MLYDINLVIFSVSTTGIGYYQMKRKASYLENAKCYSVREAAALSGLGAASAYKAVKAGIMPHIRIGRRILIPRSALEKWLDNCGSLSS